MDESLAVEINAQRDDQDQRRETGGGQRRIVNRVERLVDACQPVDAADQRVVAAHDGADHFAADQQHQSKIPFFLDAQGSIRHQIADNPADNRGDDQGQAQVEEPNTGRAVDRINAQLKRLRQTFPARIDERLTGQQRQHMGIRYTRRVCANRHKQRLAEVGNPS